MSVRSLDGVDLLPTAMPENDAMTRYLARQEAIATVRRGQSVAQFLRYFPGADGEPPRFTYVYVAPTPRSGVVAQAVTCEDVGDGQTTDVSWFPEVDEVDEWVPGLDADGNLIGAAPVPRDRSFASVEEAFESLEAEHNVHDQRWRHESMIVDEYLAARSTALGRPET